MVVELIRFAHGKESTLGMLHYEGRFHCFTLEDEYRNEKVYGKTRIPAGKYRITLRSYGGFHERYSERYPDWYLGAMLEIEDVPGFSDVLIHIGNRDEDTAGCVLVGDLARSNVDGPGFVGDSTKAFRRVYGRLVAAAKFDPDGLWIDVFSLRDLNHERISTHC